MGMYLNPGNNGFKRILKAGQPHEIARKNCIFFTKNEETIFLLRKLSSLDSLFSERFSIK